MGFGKFLGIVAGGALAVVAAPVVLGVAATAGAAAATAAGAASAAAAAAGTAAASTAVGSAVVGAASTVGTAAAAAGTAVASTTVGSAVVGTASAVGTAAATAGTAAASTVGAVVTGAAATVGSATGVSAAVALETATAGAIGSGLTCSGINVAEGISNNEDAKNIVNNVKSKYRTKTKQLEKWQRQVSKDLENLNIAKLNVYSTAVDKNIEIIKKVTVPKERELDYLDDISFNLFNDKEQIEEFRSGVIESKKILMSIGEGASFVQATASSTLLFVSQIGVASTGTSISTLSGAAAYNATIAALGGGSLISGGGGMALGHAVLGTITFVPASVITSFTFAKNSEKALTEAYEYKADVNKKIEEIETSIMAITGQIRPRIKEIQNTVEYMGSFGTDRIYPMLKTIENKYIDKKGRIDFDSCSMKDQKSLINAAYYLSKLKDILATKVFDDNGEMNDETMALIKAIHGDEKMKAQF